MLSFVFLHRDLRLNYFFADNHPTITKLTTGNCCASNRQFLPVQRLVTMNFASNVTTSSSIWYLFHLCEILGSWSIPVRFQFARERSDSDPQRASRFGAVAVEML